MNFSTCQFCNQQLFSYESHICKYEDCIPNIMGGLSDNFQITPKGHGKVRESSSLSSKLQNPSASLNFQNPNCCLSDETSVKGQTILPKNPASMNDKTACNLSTHQSNKSIYRNVNQKMSHIASPNYVSELPNQKAYMPYRSRQCNDKYVYDIKTQSNLTTQLNCCERNYALGSTDLPIKGSELSYEELQRKNSLFIQQQIAIEKGKNTSIKALREVSVNPSYFDTQHICTQDSKLCRHICIDCGIKIGLKTKLNDGMTVSDCQSFICDICHKKFICRSAFNKSIRSEDETIVIAGPSLSTPFKKKEITSERNSCAYDAPMVEDHSSFTKYMHTCSECGKQYVREIYLKRHLLTHSKE